MASWISAGLYGKMAKRRSPTKGPEGVRTVTLPSTWEWSALTGPGANGSFGPTSDPPGDKPLSRAGKPQSAGLDRRNFLLQLCLGTGAAFFPAKLWANAFSGTSFDEKVQPAGGYYLHPHYRNQRPLDATLLKVDPGTDRFVGEKYSAQIDTILETWTAELL